MSAPTSPQRPVAGSEVDATPARDAPAAATARSRTLLAGAWILLAVITLVCAVRIVAYDYRSQPVRGDQASFVLQGLSVAEDLDLAYDAGDLEHWKALEWQPFPAGLFFQAYEHGYAAAKPYGYSLVLGAAFKIIGLGLGLQMANAALFLGAVGLTALLLFARLRGPVVPLLTLAFVPLSGLYPYAFVAYTELFLYCLVATVGVAVLWFERTRRLWVALIAAAATGLLLAEKPTMAFVALPVLGYLAVIVGSHRRRLAVAGALVATFAVAVLPYLKYSDGASFTPYGAERYYAVDDVPFRDGAVPGVGYRAMSAESILNAGFIWQQITTNPRDEAHSAVLYAVGRHTGILPYVPVAALVLVLAVARVRRGPLLVSVGLAGVAVYALFYVGVFTENYYGGGQSYGNRYFLQIVPAVVLVAAVLPVSTRALKRVAFTGIALSVVFLHPDLLSPEDALIDLQRTSAAQRLLPFETNQEFRNYFICNSGKC